MTNKIAKILPASKPSPEEQLAHARELQTRVQNSAVHIPEQKPRPDEDAPKNVAFENEPAPQDNSSTRLKYKILATGGETSTIRATGIKVLWQGSVIFYERNKLGQRGRILKIFGPAAYLTIEQIEEPTTTNATKTN